MLRVHGGSEGVSAGVKKRRGREDVLWGRRKEVSGMGVK